MTVETTYTVHAVLPGETVATEDPSVAEEWSRAGFTVTARTEGQR